MIFRRFLFCASAIFLIQPASGQQTAEERLRTPAVETNPVALPEVVVFAEGEREYLAPTATTATRTGVPVTETPVSIQVVPRAVIDDQAATRLRDVYQNVSGVQPALTAGNVSTLESPIIRGFPVYTIYRDGFLVGAGVSPVNLANVERIEILKGPGSVLYGLGEPGGILNIVTKRPLAEHRFAIEQFVGSHDFYETQFDLTGPLITRKTTDSNVETDHKSGKQVVVTSSGDRPALLYRLTGSWLDSESFRDYVKTERFFVAPSLTWLPDEFTQIDFDLSYSYDRFTWDDGIFLDEFGKPQTPLESYAGEPGYYSSRDEWFAGLSLRQEITDWWKWRAHLSFHSVELRLNTWRANSPFRDATTGDLLIERDYDATVPRGMEYSAIVDTTLEFDLWASSHTLLAGIDAKYEPWNNNSQRGFRGNTPSVLNLDDPDYGVSLPESVRFTSFFSERKLFGVYLQDQIAMLDDKLHILLGGRFDYVDQDIFWNETRFGFNNFRAGATDTAFTGRAGALYEVTSWLRPYISFTQGFNPQSPFTTGGLDPETSEQIEAGVKMPFFEERLVATAAVYELTKENVASDLDGDGIPENSGELRSRGFEFDLVGKLTPSLSVIANYAYTDTEVLSSDYLPIGSRFQSVPLHSGGIFGRYEFQPGSLLSGWTAGTGVYLTGKRVADPFDKSHVGGYTRWDAFVRYRHEFQNHVMTAQLNVQNILDEEYIESVSGIYAYPGKPLSIIGSLRFEF